MIYWRHERKTVWLTLDRPPVNALDSDLLRELDDALLRLDRTPAARAAVLSGAGQKAFVAGADIAELARSSAEEVEAFARLGHRVMNRISALEVPVVAMIDGYALGGGCELALACDLRFASDRSQFALPELKLGAVPGFGGVQRLVRLVGLGRAREILFSGRRLLAEEAGQLGLVERVVPHGDLRDVTASFCDEIGASSRAATGLVKKALERSLTDRMTDALEREIKLFRACFEEGEGWEGMMAFLEKRRPRFR